MVNPNERTEPDIANKNMVELLMKINNKNINKNGINAQNKSKNILSFFDNNLTSVENNAFKKSIIMPK